MLHGIHNNINNNSLKDHVSLAGSLGAELLLKDKVIK